ncbi:MAG TPA: glycosyltransferase family 1 protein [Thermomicrobiales bacterium]|nr:glycosyltransferase family 1 protein [Thermomicrobiales bacterium]
MHTYQRNLVEALLARDSGLEYILWADNKAPFDLDKLPAHADLRLLPWSGPLSSVQIDRQLGVAMVRSGADVAHFPANYGFAPSLLPSVITLHDAINIMPLHEIWRGHAKRPKTLAMMTYLHLTTTQALRGRPLVVTVSEHARREILRHSRLDPARVLAIHSAHEPVFRRLDAGAIAEARVRLGLAGRVVLADAIKNPACTLRAWRALPSNIRDSAHLVFFSRREPAPAVRAAAERGEVRLLLRPERDDLVRLYTMADAFVFPSWYEGFGLPVLEAMACGAPVIASNRGSLPEIAGPAGTIVDAEDHDAIARELTALLTDVDRLAAMRARSLARAAGFSWERTAQRMTDVYTDLALPGRSRLAVRGAPVAAG